MHARAHERQINADIFQLSVQLAFWDLRYSRSGYFEFQAV